jgi:hypothetical protein
MERAKLRHWIHDSLLQLHPTDGQSTTQTVLAVKPSWMVLSSAEYYVMIRPTKYKKSVLEAKKRKVRRWNEQQLKSIMKGKT